jgi:hypothetical protein
MRNVMLLVALVLSASQLITVDFGDVHAAGLAILAMLFWRWISG